VQFVAFFLAIMPVLALAAPEVERESADREEILSLARETIGQARYCALVTVDASGQPRARTVDPFEPDENFVVWIATRPNTRKVEQIRQHAPVTLYYFDAERRNYVTIMGTGRLVEDVEVKNAMRRESDSDRLYPAFPDDYLLIEVTPGWLEAIVPGYRGDPDSWHPVSVTFDSVP
jgi:general stress protein 26